MLYKLSSDGAKNELFDVFSSTADGNIEVLYYIQGLEDVSGYNLTVVRESRITGVKNSPVLFEEFTYRYEEKSQRKGERRKAPSLAPIAEISDKESE